MTRLLYRTRRWAALHPWRAVGAWLLATALVLGLAAGFGGDPQDDWDVPDAESQTGLEMLRDHMPGAGNATARVVVHDPEGMVPAAALADLGARLEEMPHVVTVSPPRLSEDRDTALLLVGYDVEVTHPDLMGELGPLETAVEPARDAGLTVELNGGVPESAAAPMKGHGELVGVVVALLILVVALGYALLLVTRHDEHLRAGDHALLGRSNWWLPSWLDRRLPAVELEASYDAATPADTPRDDDRPLVGV